MVLSIPAGARKVLSKGERDFFLLLTKSPSRWVKDKKGLKALVGKDLTRQLVAGGISETGASGIWPDRDDDYNERKDAEVGHQQKMVFTGNLAKRMQRPLVKINKKQGIVVSITPRASRKRSNSFDYTRTLMYRQKGRIGKTPRMIKQIKKFFGSELDQRASDLGIGRLGRFKLSGLTSQALKGGLGI